MLAEKAGSRRIVFGIIMFKQKATNEDYLPNSDLQLKCNEGTTMVYVRVWCEGPSWSAESRMERIKVEKHRIHRLHSGLEVKEERVNIQLYTSMTREMVRPLKIRH